MERRRLADGGRKVQGLSATGSVASGQGGPAGRRSASSNSVRSCRTDARSGTWRRGRPPDRPSAASRGARQRRSRTRCAPASATPRHRPPAPGRCDPWSQAARPTCDQRGSLNAEQACLPRRAHAARTGIDRPSMRNIASVFRAGQPREMPRSTNPMPERLHPARATMKLAPHASLRQGHALGRLADDARLAPAPHARLCGNEHDRRRRQRSAT